MNHLESRARGGHVPAGRKVLVADLDGTLLGGDQESRLQLLRALGRHPEITVVFATGRGLHSVRALLRQDPLLPAPRWIVADVGASVIDATDMSHSTALERPLRRGWPGHATVREALRGFPQLAHQDVVQEGRSSFLLAPEGLTGALTAAVEKLGCSWSYSEGRYFDVLPPQAGKGPAVRQLIDKHRWPLSGLLVAGDSLNDLSLFHLRTHGVIVGNAEAALTERAPEGPLIHRSHLHGAAAILRTLRHLGWVGPPSPVVIGYHRAPARWREGRWEQPSSPNGIMPTLTSILGSTSRDGGLRAVWAAAVTGEGPDPWPVPFPDRLPMALLPLPASRWAGYFHRACKETLWPALMSHPHLIRHDPSHWADYEHVNAAFADHISAHAAQDATVWLHDYNLWLVPGLLKRARPDLTIGLFHHTPFPPPEVFRTLPVAGQLCASLARLDWAGFHTAAFADHFQQLLKGSTAVPRTGVHPLGIDRTAVTALARSRSPHVTAEDGLSVLSVERLDYAKAPVHKIRALTTLLDRRPELRGRLTLRLVCPPPEPGIRAYETTRIELEQAIATLNVRWGTGEWQPVEYTPRSLPFEEVMDHYLAAHVFWVTSLADGMNLTVQEYLTAHAASGRAGVLVLSRHAGIAQQFGNAALLTDPHDPEDLVEVLHTALTMAPSHRMANSARLTHLLDTAPPVDWARAVIAAIGGKPGPPSAMPW
ncbi:trehalose-6-phosphate synthase [Streptomyces sp. V2I9]|uniref:trehalose-6-phosphate synthase n=1 Tax=Streptomyces sp. V2I9 TaxID=3042304 RepID=UPI002789FEC1|nr:trehalose-6-phosphate synthase [Streptomyces sp. V2I9]MDQ0982821.1 trehalose-6-phosphate synthase/hydroxymethylpyrimidine pyrophosphatase-like HAD family hydrolase [Streptomyces sp. V2I9]